MADLTDEELGFLGSMFDLARSGDAVRLGEYVDQGVPVNLTTSTGDTLLILAVYYEHSSLVRALLDRSADTSRVNDRGQTALAAAVFRRAGDIVECLLGYGADPHLGGQSAYDVARFFGLADMTERLDRSTSQPQ